VAKFNRAYLFKCVHHADSVKEVANLIVNSKCTIALTGAGISTASGVPDFRGRRGLWRRVSPKVFTFEYFAKRPGDVWRLIVELYASLKYAEPNSAHRALVELENLGVLCAIITQNIDRLHQAAGSKMVVELHGNYLYVRCMSCGARYPASYAYRQITLGVEVPICEKCGGYLKPDIAFFNEPVNTASLHLAIEYARKADLILVIGSKLSVYPANTLPIEVKRRGGNVVIISDEETDMDELADFIIRGRAEEVMPMLVEEVRKALGRR